MIYVKPLTIRQIVPKIVLHGHKKGQQEEIVKLLYYSSGFHLCSSAPAQNLRTSYATTYSSICCFPTVSIFTKKNILFFFYYRSQCLILIRSNAMSDRVTFTLPANNVQTRAFRSQSFNPPPTLASHRSRRTLSLPAREKPIIPPVISETPECSAVAGEQQSDEQQQVCLEANYYDEIRK